MQATKGPISIASVRGCVSRICWAWDMIRPPPESLRQFEAVEHVDSSGSERAGATGLETRALPRDPVKERAVKVLTVRGPRVARERSVQPRLQQGAPQAVHQRTAGGLR